MSISVEVGTVVATCLGVGATIGAIMKTRFMTKTDCEKEQEHCSKHLCTKIDKLTEKIDDFKKSRSEEMKVLYSFIGRVEEYMKSHK